MMRSEACRRPFAKQSLRENVEVAAKDKWMPGLDKTVSGDVRPVVGDGGGNHAIDTEQIDVNHPGDAFFARFPGQS